MKAVLYDAPRSYAVTEIPTPDVGPGEVRIKVQQVGVCGTDLHIHNGDFNAVFPLIPGHELVGTVDALGEGVERFAVGEQVTVNPNIYCGTVRLLPVRPADPVRQRSRASAATSRASSPSTSRCPPTCLLGRGARRWTPRCSPSRRRARCTGWRPCTCVPARARSCSVPAPPACCSRS